MSYDVSIVRLRPGMSLEEARELLGHGEESVYGDVMSEEEGDEEELYPDDALEDGDEDEEAYDDDEDEEDEEDPLELVNDPDYPAERLLALAARPWLDAFTPDEERTPELEAWIARGDDSPLSPALEEEFGPLLDELSEWDSPAGTLSFCFPWENIDATMERFVQFAAAMHEHGFYVYDPQAGGIFDPTTEATALQSSVDSGQDFFSQVMEAFADQLGPRPSAELEALLEEGEKAQETDDKEMGYDVYRRAFDLAQDEGNQEIASFAAEMAAGFAAQMERFAEALPLFRHVVGADGSEGTPTAALGMGFCHLVLGEHENACRMLGRAYKEGGEPLFRSLMEDPPKELLELARQGAKVWE